MAMIGKNGLKFVVDDLTSLLFQKQVINLEKNTGANTYKFNINPDFDLPCKVDSLAVSQGDPNVSHFKVIGLDGDWTSSSTSGDFSISFIVPTLSPEVIKLGWGENAVTEIDEVTVDAGAKDVIELGANPQNTKFKGVALTLNKKKVEGSVILVNGTRTKLVVVRHASLWASILKDANGEPFAVKFTGSLQAKKDDIIVLEKKD